MKYPLTWFLAVALAAAVIWTVQSRKASAHRAQTDALRTELEQKSREVEAAQAAQADAERQRQEMALVADALASHIPVRQIAESNAAAAVAPAAPSIAPSTPPPSAPAALSGDKSSDSQPGFGALLSKMMQDPGTKQVIRNSQRMVVDQLYSPLVKRMGLTPEEATQFKDLLTDNVMSATEKAAALMGGSGLTNRIEALSGLGAEQQNLDDRLKVFLGDARYAQYKAYEETSNERQQLITFAQQSGSEHPLSEPQTEALIAIMAEERKNVTAAKGLTSSDANNSADIQASLSDDKVNEIILAQQTIGQRVSERARSFLSPDQIQAFGQFQTNQIQSMRAGVMMMRTLFSPDKAAGAAAPNP
jgi:hypothetical protein